MPYILMEGLRAAWRNLLAHRLRSFLTTLGIVIGTASVITVLSLMQGLASSISSQFSSLGGQTLTLEAKNDAANWSSGRLNFLKRSDIDLLRYKIPGVREVAPVMRVAGGKVAYRGRSTNPQVLATTADYARVEGRYPGQGRFLVDSDEQARRKVVVIGANLIEALKLPANPVGDYLSIGGDWFKIVGVMGKRGKMLGFSMDDYLVIPYSVGEVMSGNDGQDMFEVRFTIDDIRQLDSVKTRAERMVRAAHGLATGKENDFTVSAADETAKMFDKISGMTTLVLTGIVGISLLVGGVGIMTVMLVSVTERTREIGILKALGATRRDILLQFLLEAAALALMGGVVGIALGIVLGMGIGALIPDFPPVPVPFGGAAGAALFSALIGIVFGLMPASKAAKLDPIEALRYE